MKGGLIALTLPTWQAQGLMACGFQGLPPPLGLGDLFVLSLRPESSQGQCVVGSAEEAAWPPTATWGVRSLSEPEDIWEVQSGPGEGRAPARGVSFPKPSRARPIQRLLLPAHSHSFPPPPDPGRNSSPPRGATCHLPCQPERFSDK